MGGYLPYRLGLQLDKTHARYIDDVIEIEGNDLVKMELQNPGEDAPAIFIFTGTEQLRKQNNGGTFYNTCLLYTSRLYTPRTHDKAYAELLRIHLHYDRY